MSLDFSYLFRLLSVKGLDLNACALITVIFRECANYCVTYNIQTFNDQKTIDSSLARNIIQIHPKFALVKLVQEQLSRHPL